MGSSWASRAAKKLSKKGYRDSNGRSGSRRRRGAVGGGGVNSVAGARRGGVGAVVLNSESNGRIRGQPSLIGRMRRVKPTEGSE